MTPKRCFVLGMAGLGIALLGVGLVRKPAPKWLYNASESAPVGWYRVEPMAKVMRGDLVAAHLPDPAAGLAAERFYLPPGVPVIKTVWAVSGDTICVRGEQVIVERHGPLTVLSEDRKGRPLQAWREGCEALGPDAVFLVSNKTPDSFDSRYFGPVTVGDVIGRAVFLGDSIFGLEGRVKVSAGVEGDCKIKAHGANQGLVPCLHVSFYGSTPDFAEPGFGPFPNDCCRTAWLHWPFEADLVRAVPK
ncbi:S26 family signal peptidase [Hyphomonas sp.]|uniref:S26 family signal peptidase n=1 Tax=Hyphomonas sp. TaxID=87 RepID=UPI0030F69BE6